MRIKNPKIIQVADGRWFIRKRDGTLSKRFFDDKESALRYALQIYKFKLNLGEDMNRKLRDALQINGDLG